MIESALIAGAEISSNQGFGGALGILLCECNELGCLKRKNFDNQPDHIPQTRWVHS